MDFWLDQRFCCDAVSNGYIQRGYCILCSCYLGGDEELHRRDPVHRGKVQEANDQLSLHIMRLREVHELLGDWQDQAVPLYEPLLSYLFQKPLGTRMPVKYKRELDLIVDRLKWDCSLNLLELSLWKAACLLNPPEQVMRSVASVMHWTNSGWKDNKEAMRSNELITVVMENVIGFLGKPP